MKYIVANWKANKTPSEAKEWLETFAEKNLGLFQNNVQIILAVPFPFLMLAQDILSNAPHIKLCAQNVSHFGAGSYTGEVSAVNLEGLVEYIIVGHSERRKYLHENSGQLLNKIELASECKMKSILCVSNVADEIPKNVQFVAYEPLEAIGTGQGENLENVLDFKKKLEIPSRCAFFYGGSVDIGNVESYISNHEVDGCLVGKASLDVEEFYDLCLKAHLSA